MGNDCNQIARVQHVFDTWENLAQALDAGGHGTVFGGVLMLEKILSCYSWCM